MKKDALRGIVIAAVLLLVYHLIVFVAPFYRGGVFWVGYGFTLAAFAVAIASSYIAFVKNPDAKSRFYGFPIAKIGVIYWLGQLVLSLAFSAAGKVLPPWVAVIVFALALAAAVVGLVSAEVVVEEIQTQDTKLKKDVSVMRALQSKVNQMVGMAGDDEAGQAVKAFAEELRYSDPVSGEAAAEIEQELAQLIDTLQQAVVDGDSAAALTLCRKAGVALAERNRLCKLNK